MEGKASAAQVEEGKEVFSANGCGDCHALSAAGASGTVGPDLDEVLPGSDSAFVEESIVDPEAEITPGYSGGIMPTASEDGISDAELAALVAFLHQEAGK